MTPPTIKALGVIQEWSPTSWKASGFVKGIGWLAAWGPSLIGALAALQALAAQGVAGMAEGEEHRP